MMRDSRPPAWVSPTRLSLGCVRVSHDAATYRSDRTASRSASHIATKVSDRAAPSRASEGHRQAREAQVEMVEIRLDRLGLGGPAVRPCDVEAQLIASPVGTVRSSRC